MAADQRKKRFNASSSLADCTSRDQYRVKRKRLEESRHNNLKMIPTISLEWDSKKNGVVSRRNQIGISKRQMSLDPAPYGHKLLADVLSVPQEIFQLENLSEIMSYEVWQSHLSENERSFLSGFLPKETDPDTVVRDLLDGNNFHFGNPLLDWGNSLCSGELHPDNVLHKEHSLKACKKAYHLNIQNYHNDMIENLETWKEKWFSSDDPEADILQKMWRSRKHTRKSLLPPETRIYDIEENYVATPESANSEKVESHKRKRLLSKKSDSSSSGLKVVSVPNQGEKVHKRNIQNEDGAKYMSYIKVSKEQHDRVKSSMKHTGNSIQPRSLNNVLGSIDALNVQPFERFEEEERNNIHDYWLKLANGDIPGYFAAWKSRQLQRQQVTWSLFTEIKVKLEHVEVNEDKEEECHSKDYVMEPSLQNDSVEVLPVEVVDKVQQSSSLLEKDQMDDIQAIHEVTTDLEDVNEKKEECIFEEQKHDDSDAIEEDEVREHVLEDCNANQHNASSLNDIATTRVSDMIEPPTKSIFLKVEQDQQQIPLFCPISNNRQVINNSVEMQQSHCSSASAKTEGEDASPPIVSEYHHSPGNVDISVSQRQQGKSDVWAAAGEIHHGSYYQSPTQELSPIGHPQFIQEQQQQPVQNQMLDLESNRNKDHVLHRETHDMSFFNPYSNTTTQDRNELLQTLGSRNDLPYLCQSEKMQLGLHRQPVHDAMMEEIGGQFTIPQHHHQSLALDIMSQKRLNDVLYLQQQSSIQDNSLFSIPSSIRQEEQFGMSTPLSQPQLNQNWFMVQNNTSGSGVGRDVWAPSFEGGVGGSINNDNSDQSLYSVLSECNELRSAAAAGTTSYDPVSSTEQYIQAHAGLGQGGNNYNGRIGVDIPIPSSSSTAITNYNMLQQLAPNHGHHPLNYLSGHEPAAVVATGGLNMLSNNTLLGLGGGPWSLPLPHPQQNPPSGRRIHDSSLSATKPPFLRSSWNQ